MASTTTPAETTWSPRLWGALFVLCGALFLDGLDVSMVGVALPSIGTDLHMSTTALQWVVSGYVLGYGGLLLLGGRAADLLGRRRMFLIAVAAFAAASLLGGLVHDGTLLVATRFIKGIAAAFTAPAGLSIITTTFAEGPARNRALSIYTIFGASGFSSGLILGGLMTEVGWRWTFLLPVPVALLALVAGIRLLDREERPATRQGGYDILGAVTSTAAMLLLVYAIVQAPHTGWTHPLTLGAFAAVAILLAAFVAIERRTAFPLVRLGILRSASLIRANFGVLAMFGSYIGFQFIGTLYMQSLLGWAPLQMALAFLPAGLIVGSSALLAPRLVERFGATRLVIAGFTSLTAGYLLFLRVGVDPHYATDILPSILLLGVGFALAFSPLNILATSGIANEEQGLAGGLFQTSGQLGGALVMAAVTAVVTAGGEHRDAPAATVLASFRPGLVLVSVVALLGVLVALTGVRRRAVSVQPEPERALATVD